MSTTIHLTLKFKKKLESLHQAGGEAAVAARRAEAIVETLVSEGCGSLDDAGRLTRFGEKRIRGCLKYDLGRGYRVIFVTGKETIVFLFVGTHDEAARWLRRNTGLDFEHMGEESAETIIARSEQSESEEFEGNDPEAEADYDDLLMDKIDHKVLRSIFSGLCGE